MLTWSDQNLGSNGLLPLPAHSHLLSSLHAPQNRTTSGSSLWDRGQSRRLAQQLQRTKFAAVDEEMEAAPIATAATMLGAPNPAHASGLRCRWASLRAGGFVQMGGAGRPAQKPAHVRAQQSESKDKSATFSLFGDSLANSVEVRQWESGYSFDDIASSQGIRIRRRPPSGPPQHYVGPFEFRLENEGNTPRNILEKIIWNKDVEVQQLKQRNPLPVLKGYIADAPPVRDFIGALRASYNRTGMPALIAEVKKASPSRGVLREDFDPVHIANAYEAGGAACLSVLTDEKFFQGSFENLEAIRKSVVKCPLLCKEFIIEAWQIYYARCKGADAILLIAAVLPDLDIKYMIKICRMLGMAALVEVHDERELDRVLGIDGIQLIGINNRNLETFEVDISNTKKLLDGERGEIICQRDIIVVGESGLFTPQDIAYVQEAGVKAVLVGESLVKQEDPKKGIAGLYGKEISA